MKRKNNIITTISLICALLLITLLPLPVAEAASFTVSKSNVSIQNGSSSTITIKAPTHTGRIDIISSNSNVAAVSETSLWVENNSKTITISGKSAGTATITIKGELYDESIGEEAEYTKTVNVTVTKASNSNNTGGSNTSGTTGGTSNSGTTSSGGTQNNGSTSSGSTSNSGTTNSGGSTQNSGSSSSGSQSVTTTSRPSSSSTSSKPSNSSTTTANKNESNVNVNNSASSEQTAPIEENIEEEVTVSEDNVLQEETKSEEVLQEESEENISEDKLENAEINNAEHSNSINSNGKIIIITVIGIIALVMIFIGIGVSKNIFKK